MLLQERLKEYPFSNSERTIVEYILTHPQELKERTLKELAEETYTSPSTFVRISHKMKYDGWNDMKADLIREHEYLQSHFSDIDANYPFRQNDTVMSIAAKIAGLEQETIEDTLSLITHDDLMRALSILRKADVIHVFAVSNNCYLAEQFAHAMSRIGKDVRIHSLQSELIFNAAMAKQNSCAIVISYSGETDVLLKCIDALKNNHVPVLALTAVSENSIADASDCVLRLCTREKLYSKIANFSVNTSVMYLLDVLYSCLFREHYDRNLELKTRTSKMIESGRFASNEIQEEEENQFIY